MVQTLYTLLVSGGASTLSAVVMAWLMRKVYVRDEEQRRTQEKELNAIREGRIKKLEDGLAELSHEFAVHKNDDKGKEIFLLLREMEKRTNEWQKRIEGQLEILSAKVDRSLESNAAQSRDIENNLLFVNNLRQDLQAHIQTCGGKK